MSSAPRAAHPAAPPAPAPASTHHRKQEGLHQTTPDGERKRGLQLHRPAQSYLPGCRGRKVDGASTLAAGTVGSCARQHGIGTRTKS